MKNNFISMQSASFKLGAVVIVVALLIAPKANTANIIYSEPGMATAIQGLNIDGALYDVDFEAPTYSTFGGDTDFWLTGTQAETAISAINQLFNDRLEPVDRVNNSEWVILYGVNYVGGSEFGLNTADALSEFPDWQSGGFGLQQPSLATAWRNSTIPIPAAAYLFASGLGLLGWLRRRKTA